MDFREREKKKIARKAKTALSLLSCAYDWSQVSPPPPPPPPPPPVQLAVERRLPYSIILASAKKKSLLPCCGC